jgi:hypothetical protein
MIGVRPSLGFLALLGMTHEERECLDWSDRQGRRSPLIQASLPAAAGLGASRYPFKNRVTTSQNFCVCSWTTAWPASGISASLQFLMWALNTPA